MIGQLILLFFLCVFPFTLFFSRSYWVPDGYGVIKISSFNYKLQRKFVMLKGGRYHFIIPFTYILKNSDGNIAKIPISTSIVDNIGDLVVTSKDEITMMIHFDYSYTISEPSHILGSIKSNCEKYGVTYFNYQSVIKSLFVNQLTKYIKSLEVKFTDPKDITNFIRKEFEIVCKKQTTETGINIDKLYIHSIKVYLDPQSNNFDNYIRKYVDNKSDCIRKEDERRINSLINSIEKSVKLNERVKNISLNLSLQLSSTGSMLNYELDNK